MSKILNIKPISYSDGADGAEKQIKNKLYDLGDPCLRNQEPLIFSKKKKK